MKSLGRRLKKMDSSIIVFETISMAINFFLFAILLIKENI